MIRIGLIAAALVLAPPALVPAIAQTIAPTIAPTGTDDPDRHSGYYYPPAQTAEDYVSRAVVHASASREARLGFVTGITQQQLARPYPPPYVVFVKGDDADKLIIVAMGQNGFRTLYQARALLAQLTAVARTTTLLRELGVEDIFTFFDLARMLGFKQITVSDGDTFAHRIVLK